MSEENLRILRLTKRCGKHFHSKFSAALDKDAHAGQTCTVWSSYHFRTFDGHAFDFPGLCRYELSFDARDMMFAIELIKNAADFLEEGHGDELDFNRHRENNTETNNMLKETIRNYTGEFMAIELTLRGVKDPFYLLPEKMLLFGEKRIMQRQFTHRGVSIETIGRYLRVRTRVGLTILWDGEGVLDIELDKSLYNGKVAGLCGNFDTDPFNDIVMKDGSKASDLLYFAMAWRVNEIHKDCVDITYIPVYCSNHTSEEIEENRVVCEVIIANLPAFLRCRESGIDPVSFVDACMVDLCRCKKKKKVDCSCNALNQYSRLCAHETGIAPEWRTQDLCGVTCQPGMVYSECSSSCPRTCQNLVTPETECDDHCMDGCACINGTVLRHDNTCVLEEECPCIHNERFYPPGYTIKQECLECQCEGALWNCKSLPCVGECSVVGDSHYTTFDGMVSKIYGECQFTFVKDCNGTDLFTVLVENSFCANGLTETCINEVLVSLTPIASGPSTARTSSISDNRGQIQIRFAKGRRITVDEQEVVLPIFHEHFQIFQASSEFIQFHLNTGIVLEWDGSTRLYVRVERVWMNKLCGICGNFNDNKRDDMMNINGLIEKSATAFSNLWKVNSDCRDATPDINLDPCVAHPQRAEFAKQRCRIIREDLFQKCHSFVSPEEAEQICRQDVCQCDKGVDCLCNAIAHYARQCAKKGQIVHWRTKSFCPVACGGGQIYQPCGSSCLSTCRSISDPRARCSEVCIEGCNCPQNLYLNEYNRCVPKAECQCYHNGKVYKAFYISRREYTSCHCRDGLYTCQNLDDLQIPGSPAEYHNRSICKPGWMHKTCQESADLFDGYPQGIECQKTCKTIDTRCIATECVEGCGCPVDLVLDPDRDVCVDRNECPCYFGGSSYTPGETLKVDCNTCRCERREWICTNDLCVGTCTAYGDPHYLTFDGYKFDFMGECNYILTQDYCGNQEGQFRVYVENTNCGSDSASCTKSVTLILTGTVSIKLNKDVFGYEQHDLVTWGAAPGSHGNYTKVIWDFHHVGLYTIVTTDIGLTIVWDKKTTVYVKLHPKYKGRVCGLCGDFDDNQNNDMIMSDRMLAINPTEFGNSWKQSPSCHDASEQESQCDEHPTRRMWAQRSCQILYSEKFAVCHAVVDVVWYHTNCIYDACACDGGGDCECLCTAIAAYAHACSDEGIKIRWRTPHVCPLMCEGYSEDHDCIWHYSECEDACPQTCQHRYLTTGYDSCPLSVPCVEGCFPYCPEGMFYDEHLKNCVQTCEEGCHANGRFYLYGEVIKREECRVCICEVDGDIICKVTPECKQATSASVPHTAIPTTPEAPSTIAMTTTTSLPTSGFTSSPRTHILGEPKTKRYCAGKVNLNFLLDGSHQISTKDFEITKDVVTALVESIVPYDYGRSNSSLRLAVEQYSEEIEVDMSFEHEQDLTSFVKTLRDMELQNGDSSNLNLALQKVLEMFIEARETNQDKKQKDGASSIEDVLFIIMFSTPDDEFDTTLKEIQNLGVKVIVLPVGSSSNERRMKATLGEDASVHFIEDIFHIVDQTRHDVAMRILEDICTGKPINVSKIIPTPVTTIPTQPPATTTSVIAPFESCTMTADLVVIIDIALLTGDEEDVNNFLNLLKMILSDTLVRPDRTHVTILLADKRVWRIGRFISTRQELLGDLENSILTKVSQKVYAAKHFDLDYALEQATDGYLFNERSGVRGEELNVHKSVLVFQAREAFPQTKDKDIEHKMSLMEQEQVVFSIIIHRKTFRGFRSKNEWKKLMKMKNILFADLATSKVTRTRFSRMMDRVCRTPPKLPMPLIYCQGYTDLYFLWDDSDNIESKDLKNMMRATKKIARSLRFDNFGSDKESPLRIAIAQYSDEVNFLLDTGDHSNLHEFVDAPVPGIPYWSMGSESHLGEALSQIGQKFKAVVSERNKTLVIFTSRISTDPIDQPLNDLLAVGTKIVAIGFSPDSTSKQLKKIAGDSGWFKRLASSREILDNDIGIALADEICLPGIPPPLPTGTTQAVTTPAVITSERYAISTKAALNATTISPPACIMSDDIQILIDSKFTTGDAMSSMVSEVLLQVISELKIDKVSSRVGAAVVGHKVEPASGLNDQGVNKNELLRIFLNLDSQMKSHSPFSLTEAIEMSEEFVFNANPREGEEDYKKDVVLVVDRLPENEIDLFREESLKSVRSTIDNLIEEDYGVYLVYTDKTFQNFTFTLQKKWLKGLEGSSLLLEVTDNPKIFGSELIDMICTVPTMTTAFLKTSLPYTTSTPLFTEKTERTTAKIITPTKEEPLSSTATTEFFTEKTRPKMTSEISTSKNYTSLATTRISKSTEAESTFYQTTSQFFPSTTAPPLSTVPESTTTSIEEIESTQIMSSTSPTEARLGNCTVDLQIILDSSYSIGRKFIYVKEFLLKLIENFDVENDLVRVGLIQYSGGVKSEFQLKDHIRDSSAIVQSIKDMTLLSGTTNTYSAIEYTLDNEISESTGKRSGIPLVILLLTDGRIKDHEKEDLVLEKLEDKRREIQKAGVRFDVMALGIASAREEELLKISSHPEYTSYIGNFKDVFKLVDKLITHVCFPQPTLAPPSTTTREQITTPPAECAYMPATDLLFILDGSMDLVDSDRLESYQKFLVEMVPKFKIGQSDTQIGVVFYGEEVYNSAPHGFGINEHGNVRQLIGAISKMELPGDFSSEIKPTLKKIFSNAFPGPVEGRESARKVAVVIITVPVWEATGGERLADIFRDATDRGIEVLVAVAPNEDIMINRIRDVVGPYVDSENKIDVSGGVSQLIVKSEDFKQKICGEGPSTTTLTTMTMKSVVSTEKLFSTSEKIIPATSAIIPETVTSIPSSSTSRIKSRPVSTVSTRISTKEVEVQTTSVLQGCENMPATDVVFVIDGSRSPGMRSNAEDYKTFLKKVVNEFRISFDRTQVSVSTYNDDIFNESPHGFKLSALRTKNEILELINNLEFPNGYMLNSVEPVAKILQSSFEEILGGRSDARKIAVVFQTSVDTSFLNQNLSSVLENAFHDGIETVYVGIPPSSDMPDLLHDIMLSAGSFINNSMKIPVPGGFPDLSSHAYDVRDAICGKLPVATSKEISPTSVTEEVSSLVPEKTTPVTVTPSPLCQDRVDLMFTIDQSFMNSRVLKQAVKEYLHRAFATLGVGTNKVQVSLVIIGSSLDVVLEFDSGSQSREKALEIVDSFFSKRKRYGRLNQFPTQSALTYALNMFSSRHRSEGSTLVMLIRTPLSRPDEEIRAQLTTDSIVVSVIARERARGARAKSLASQGSFYHSVSNLRQLKMTGNRIKEIVCTERPVTPPRYSSPCLHFVADVVFMIDGLHLQQPGSVVRNILVDLVEGFDVGGMVNVAGVSYGNSATVNFKLDSFKTKEQVQKAVKEMQFDGDVTVSDVQGALNFTAQKIIISNSNRRKFVPVYIVNLVGRPVWEVDDFSSILGDLAEQNVFVITLGPGGSHWHNFTVLPNSTFTTFNDTEEFSHFADDLTEILCLQYPFPTATLPVTTSTILTPSEVCTVRNDVLFVVDNNLLHTSSQIEQIRNYFTVIEKKVFMDEMFTRAGLLVTGPNVTVWKRLNENDITLTNALNSKILSAALTGEIQIDLVMDQALFMFDHNSNHQSSKRHLVLLFSREVKGHISEDHWLRLKTLDIALDVITVGTRFLKSDAVDTITYNELPIPSVDYLSNAAFEMVRMLCEDIIIPIPTVPPGITTTSAPFLICPPGDVILMYDSLFLYPESDSAKMKDFLKDIVDIMSNTYAADKTRFALVSFGESPELHFGLDSIKTAVQVKNAIDQSQHHGSDSPLNAGHALNYILNNVMTEQRTVRHVTVLMLISRPSFDNLKAVVQTATDAIDLITFGMGIPPSELDELTTIPYGGIPVQDMDKFEDLEYETLELICTVSPVTTTAPPPSVSTTEKPLYPCKVDLMFMLDEDLTTSPKTLFYTKRYLSIIAERLSFNEDYFQVGLMRFSDESSPVTFGFTNTHASFKESVDSDLHVSPVTGSLMLNSGLDSALKEFDRHGRKDDDVMRLIVFILRRQSSHNIDVGKLKTLSDAGIVILSIVIDDAMFIPSSTLTNYEHGYVQAYRPQYLTYFASPVVYTVWNIACVKTKPTALYPTTTPLLIPTTASAPPGVCSRIMDVAFLIDQSLMVDEYKIEITKSFVKDSVRSLDFSPDTRVQKTRVSVIQYSFLPKAIVNLREFYDKSEALKAIESRLSTPEKLSRPQSHSSLVPALSYASKHVLNEEGMRVAEKVIVLLAERPFNDSETDVLNELENLQRMGVALITVGLDSSLRQRINELTTIPDQGVLSFSNIDEMPGLLPTVKEILCEGVPVAPVTTEKFPITTLPYVKTSVIEPKTSISPSPVVATSEGTGKYLNFTEILETTAFTRPIQTTVTQKLTPSTTEETAKPATSGYATSGIPASSEVTEKLKVSHYTTEKVTETTESEIKVEAITPKFTAGTSAESLVVNCDELKLDLLILLQASSHFSKFGSQKMKSISNQLARSFKFGKDNVLISVMQFDDDVTVHDNSDGFQFKDIETGSRIASTIFNLHIHEGVESHPGKALKTVVDNYMTSAQGARADVRKAVVMVVGEPMPPKIVDEFNRAIRYALERGISIFLIIVPLSSEPQYIENAKNIAESLHQLQTNNKMLLQTGFKDFYLQDFDVETLSKDICRDIPRTVPYPEIATTAQMTTLSTLEVNATEKITSSVKTSTAIKQTTSAAEEKAKTIAATVTQETSSLAEVSVKEETSSYPEVTSTTKASTAAEKVTASSPATTAALSQSTIIPMKLSTTAQITPLPVKPSVPVTTPDLCEYPSDTVLVVDTSNVAEQNLAYLQQFLTSIVNKFTDQTNFAIVSYGDTAQVVKTFEDTIDVQTKINSISRTGKFTYTGSALQRAQDLFNEARGDVPWSVLLLTDGRSKDSLQDGIESLRNLQNSHPLGMKFTAVGIQSASVEELNQFADEQNIVYIDTYANLLNTTAVDAVFDALCGPYEKASLPDTSTIVTSAVTSATIGTTTSRVETTPSKTTTIRMTTIMSSTTSYTEVCDCYWTDYISRDKPSPEKPGDDESWVYYESTNGVCRSQYSGYKIQCQSSEGFLQPNFVCNIDGPPPICWSFEVEDGSSCHDYSISVQCCSSACEERSDMPPPPALIVCSREMDVAFLIDTDQSSSMLHDTKNFLNDFTGKMKLRMDYSRVSLVEYGSNGSKLDVSWTIDEREWKTFIDSLQSSPPGDSDVAPALRIVLEQLAPKARIEADGYEVAKVVVLLLTGSSMGAVDGPVMEVRQAGFRIVVIGMNTDRKTLMRRLADDSSSIVTVSDSTELRQEGPDKLVEMLCMEEEETTPPPTSTVATAQTRTQQLLSTTPATGKAFTTEAISAATKAPELRKTTSATTETIITTSPKLKTTEIFTTTVKTIPTTTPTPTCVYYNEKLLQSMIIEFGQVIYPNIEDKCSTIRCNRDGTLTFSNKRLLCEEIPKPKCDNGFEPVLRYDSGCNCQWECQCYCQVSGNSYHTFDGLQYSVQGECSYVLAQATSRAVRSGRSFKIIQRLERCNPNSKKSCVSEVAIQRLNGTVILFRNYTATLNSQHFESNPTSGIHLSIVGHRKFVVNIDDIGLEVKFEPEFNGITVSMPAYIWDSNTEGMCGTCNHDTSDELRLRNKTITTDIPLFARDWFLEKQTCEEPGTNVTCVTPSDQLCHLIINGSMFDDCRSKVDWERYYRSCLKDTCRNPDTVCDILAGFAEACRHGGECVDWRKGVCEITCENGTSYRPCVEPPYQKSCPPKEPVQLTTKELAEGCFLQCEEEEVVIDGKCVSKEYCDKCYDKNSTTFIQPGEFWFPADKPCHVCSCLEDLAIECTRRPCTDKKTIPGCGQCEKISLVAESDTCCPEYECVCTYDGCDPVPLMEPCQDGSMMRILTNTSGCRPIYGCICEIDKCVFDSTSPCTEPMVQSVQNTTCCPKSDCTCPDSCDEDNIICDLGYSKTIHSDICNCSKSECVSMPVCVVSINDRKVIKTLDEEWRDPGDHCIVCKCEADKNSNADFYPVTCRNTSEICKPCGEAFRSEYMAEECCPRCIPNACVYTNANNSTTIFLVGDEWPKTEGNICQNLTCVMSGDVPAVIEIIRDCVLTSPGQCDFGFKMKCDTDPCCPECHCVPDEVCNFNDSLLQKPGQSWTVNECMTCECTGQRANQESFYEHVCTNVYCVECSNGFEKREINGTCCGECVPTECTISLNNTLKVLQVDEELTEGCSVAKCIRNNRGYVMSVVSPIACPPLNIEECVHLGGVVGKDEKGCCSICQFQQRECQVREGQSVTLTINGCIANRPIMLSYCEGQCASSSHYHIQSGRFVPHCTCCKPVTYDNRTQEATCQDGTTTHILYRHVTGCNCESVMCSEWTRIDKSGKEIVTYRIEPEKSSSSHQNNSNYMLSWTQNNTVNVFEITNVSANYWKNDVLSVVQETMKKYGNVNLPLQVIEVDASNSSLSESLKEVIKNAINGKNKDV